MAISAETEAIISRLKAEGQLTRNSGSNSIRSVKIQLNRFEDVFNTISMNIAEQTSILRKSIGIQEEAIEKQRRKEDLEEIQQPVKEDPPTTDSDETSAEKEKSKGLFDFLAGVGGTLLGSLKPLLIGSAGLFVAYNFAKGFIDEKTGGGFTRFEDSMVNTFREVDWTALGESFITFASKVPEAVIAISDFLSNPLAVILAGAGLTAATIMAGFAGGALARGVTAGIIDGVLGRRGDGAQRGPGGSRGLFNLRNVARASGIGILVGALEFFSEDVKNWLKNQGVPENWADESVDSAITIGTFTSIGMLFGIKGALFMAAIGTAYVLGRKIYEWFEGRRAAAAAAAQARLDAMNVITGEGLGDETGITDGSAETASPGVTPEARALGAEQSDARVAEIFEKVRNGGQLTAEEIAILRTAFNAADVQLVEDRIMNIGTELTNAINNAMDGLGTEAGDLGLSRATNMLESLERLIGMDPENLALRTLYNTGLLSLTGRAGLEGLGDFSEGSDDLEALTPTQRQLIDRIRRLELMSDQLPQPLSNMTLGDQSFLDQIAAGGMGSVMPPIVIGKVGGDTYQTISNTRGGDMNVADTKVYAGSQGNSMSPLTLTG